MQDGLRDPGGELGTDDLIVEAVVEHVMARRRSRLGRVLLAEQMRWAREEPVRIDLRAELQRLRLDAVDRDSGTGQFERQSVTDLGPQGDPVGMQKLGERLEHVLDVEIGQGPHVVVADLLDDRALVGAGVVVVDGRRGHHLHRADQER